MESPRETLGEVYKKRVLNSWAGRLFIDRKFFLYTCVGVFISILNIFLLWLFIDVLQIPTVLASTVVIGATFIFRYILFKIFGIV